MYWRIDGIHTGLRSEKSDGQCLLVIIGVRPDGSKERVAIGDGYRETKASWLELLLDLKARGLQADPLLAVCDGAMGFWAALEEVFSVTRGQRCWFHEMGSVLNALPKSQQARAKADMQAIWMAATRRGIHHVRSFRAGLCGEVSEGDGNVEEGSGHLAGLLEPVRILCAEVMRRYGADKKLIVVGKCENVIDAPRRNARRHRWRRLLRHRELLHVLPARACQIFSVPRS